MRVHVRCLSHLLVSRRTLSYQWYLHLINTIHIRIHIYRAPYCLKICIEYTTHEPVSHAFDVICDFTAASNPCLNAIILFKLDSKVRNNLLELVGRNRSSLASQASKLALSTSRISPPSIAVVINRSILSNGGGPKSPKAVRTAPASPSVEQDPSAPVFQKEEVDPVDSMMPSISNLQSLHVKEAKVEQ